MNGVLTAMAVDRLALSRERLRQALRVSSASPRNPLVILAGTVVLGGLLARMRPWRWVPKSVLFAGLLPLVSQTVTRLPPSLWVNVLASLAQKWSGPATSSLATRANVSRAPVSSVPAVRKM